MISHKNYLILLGAIFSLLWLILAIKPLYRKDWLMENVLVFIFVASFAFSFKRFSFSRVSLTLIFLFLCLHELGAHYTYSEVPYNQWSEAIFGRPLNSLLGWERNNFDRCVHFLYGLLLCYPVREIYLRIADVRGFWGYFLPLDFTMSTSMLYELFEWAAAEIFGGELGTAYLGTQGDVWDAQKDMLFATTGAFLSMAVTAAINYYLRRDFASEWAESLRVKGKKPLGENEIIRISKKGNNVVIQPVSSNSFQFENLKSLRESLYRGVKLAKFQKILDIGSGDLKIAEEILKLSRNDVFAIDLKKPQNIAKGVFFLRGDALNLPFKDNSFNMVSSSFFFVWQKELGKIIKEIKRILDKNGFLLIISEPIYKERKILKAPKFSEIQKECYKKLGANFDIENDLLKYLSKMGFKTKFKKTEGENKKIEYREILEEIDFFYQIKLIDSQTRQILINETVKTVQTVSLPVLYGWSFLP